MTPEQPKRLRGHARRRPRESPNGVYCILLSTEQEILVDVGAQPTLWSDLPSDERKTCGTHSATEKLCTNSRKSGKESRKGHVQKEG